MNEILKVYLILILLTHYLVNTSPISDNSSVDKSQKIVQNEENDGENDNKAEEKTDTEDKSKSDHNDNNDNEDENGEDINAEESSSSPIDSLEASQSGTKLLIILVDGFRYDYVSRDKTLKGFPRIAKSGVRAEYVKPIFPPNSYPNWYSIVTGLYGESHGIVENNMFDRSRNDLFLMTNPNASHIHWWDKSEPIWITAEKNGVKAGVYLWDGCQVRIRGRKPTVCIQYRPLSSSEGNAANNETRRFAETILDHFSHDKYRLALLYHENVDFTGHLYGPRSRKTKQAVRDIDDILYDLQDSIIKRQLEDVNVVVVSDHGMIQTDDADIIQIEDILDFNDVEIFVGGGALAQILPEHDKEEEVFEQLRQAHIKGLNIYKKENIPERFHFKNNENVLPIFITADVGFLIKPPNIKGKVYPENYERMKGYHGYDPDHVEQMRAIMYGFGPAFRKDYISKPLEQVDHYNLFCHLINIKANPNNGTFIRVEKLLKESEEDESDDESSEEDELKSDNEDDGDGVSINKLNSFLIYCFIFKFSYLMFNT